MRTEQTKYQTKCKLKKGDIVRVLAGRAKGGEGPIDRIDRKHERVYVAGINIRIRQQKATPQNPEAGPVEKVMPLPISNVALLDPKKKVPTRIGYKFEDGKKVRFAKKSGTILD